MRGETTEGEIMHNDVYISIDPDEDDGKGGNPPTGDGDDGRQYNV